MLALLPRRLLLALLLALLPLSCLAGSKFDPSTPPNPETQQRLLAGIRRAQLSIQSTDISNPRSAIARAQISPYLLLSHSRKTAHAGFLLVELPGRADASAADLAQLRVLWYRQSASLESGPARVAFAAKTSLREALTVAFRGLRAEGWVWFNYVFDEAAREVRVVDDGSGSKTMGGQVSREVRRQLQLKGDQWVALEKLPSEVVGELLS
ncbi:MAG: hypothetical protein M1829_003846 [Trizodia sp. TS-e1964]|nr:MAG: hypothetical protein M1829_003846 [Trizodia sp. TS-e1964]